MHGFTPLLILVSSHHNIDTYQGIYSRCSQLPNNLSLLLNKSSGEASRRSLLKLLYRDSESMQLKENNMFFDETGLIYFLLSFGMMSLICIINDQE